MAYIFIKLQGTVIKQDRGYSNYYREEKKTGQKHIYSSCNFKYITPSWVCEKEKILKFHPVHCSYAEFKNTQVRRVKRDKSITECILIDLKI